jgi:hypothetical protein
LAAKPKDIEPGGTPVPVNWIDSGTPLVGVNVNVALAGPVAVGLKTTLTVQVLFNEPIGPTTALLHRSVWMLYSLAAAPLIATSPVEAGKTKLKPPAGVVLVTVATPGALVVPRATLPKASGLGVTV